MKRTAPRILCGEAVLVLLALMMPLDVASSENGTTHPDWASLLETGTLWVFSVADSSGKPLDTLRITKVGGSRAAESIYTSIWQLNYTTSESRPFPMDTDTVFAGCDGDRFILQGQNQCCPSLALTWPPEVGKGDLPGDTTRIDSIWVAGIEDVTVPAGDYHECAVVLIRERAEGRHLFNRLWISPQVGIVLIEHRRTLSEKPLRRWQLLRNQYVTDSGEN